MRPLAADLRSRHPPPRWAWMVLAALLLAAAALAMFALKAERDLAASRVEELALRQDAAASPRPQLPRVQPVMPYDASARAVLAQAQAGWGPLLASLESMEVVGVTPVSIDVSTADRQIRVDLEFSDLATLLRFVDEINAGEPAPRWRLLQAQGAARVPTMSAAATVATILGTW